MKRNRKTLVALFVFLLTTYQLYAQTGSEPEKLGLPGDNLNLYAVMKLFQESPTLEEFEKKLNEENSQINNLDLNGDDETDYIKVLDEVEGTVHNIVLQVAVSATENQDVAVFTVEKNKDGSVDIQLTGDEELYGKDYIIEPNTAETGSTPNPGYTGAAPANQVTRTLDDKQIVVNNFTTVEIQRWPIVQFMYVPTYVVWRSPWYWGHYPGWWRPWRPAYWDFYFGYHYNYYSFYWGWYRRWPYHRHPYWNDYYYHRHRAYSPWVYQRRNSGYYQRTYSRPELRRDGMAHYTKVNPKGPVLRPGLNRPAPRPTMPAPRPNPGTRPTNPGTRPTPTKPAPKPTNPTRPAPKPVNPTRPAPKPTQPTRPVTRPTQPTRPAPKPAPKPAPSTRPAPRPTQSTRPTPKPAPKPAPSTRPTTRPTNG